MNQLTGTFNDLFVFNVQRVNVQHATVFYRANTRFAPTTHTTDKAFSGF